MGCLGGYVGPCPGTYQAGGMEVGETELTRWCGDLAAQKRSAKRERERRARLSERGISEKSVERD